jgi:hypothetical protein
MLHSWGDSKNKTSGSAPQSQIPVVSGPEVEHILPIQPIKKERGNVSI